MHHVARTEYVHCDIHIAMHSAHAAHQHQQATTQRHMGHTAACGRARRCSACGGSTRWRHRAHALACACLCSRVQGHQERRRMKPHAGRSGHHIWTECTELCAQLMLPNKFCDIQQIRGAYTRSYTQIVPFVQQQSCSTNSCSISLRRHDMQISPPLAAITG